ncbi:hypothetical protein CKO_01688 [Citrobacter koseri ATCC BAA-895]|uniref:Uncharacterized protein n=1 Tax=Citrobacter koseri (strain ATCC BAA-895 / CDC 4225-83 / SGSC4696) TaxID=290338 RepID=A8AH56_CITK8|nr:hypothetical protein CKO_01688 [Citrobacter koseri ATCC BAA-895]
MRFIAAHSREKMKYEILPSLCIYCIRPSHLNSPTINICFTNIFLYIDKNLFLFGDDGELWERKKTNPIMSRMQRPF